MAKASKKKKATKSKEADKAAEEAAVKSEALPLPLPAEGTASIVVPMVPVVAPYTPPTPQKFELYEPAELQQQHRRPLSLDQVRFNLAQKVKKLQAAKHPCPDALYTDVENCIIWLQTSEIGDVVKQYIRLIETLRFWMVHCEEQGRVVERQRKKYQRQMQTYHRSTWNVAVDGKSTNDAVDAKVRSDEVHEQWLGYQEDWEFLGKQINQLVISMQTEMLVQSSVWTQHELGMRNTAPAGAVGP